jgi:hypothetical protein
MSDTNKESAQTGGEKTPKNPPAVAGNAAETTDAKQNKGVGRFGLRVGLNAPSRELYVSTTRAVAGVSVASFCGLLIGVIALSRNATQNGPQAARADEGRTPSIIAPVVKPTPVTVTKAVAPKPVQVIVSTPNKPAPLVTAAPVNKAVTTPAVSTPKVQAPAATVKASEGRIIGMTYFVFGSFPKPADAKTALEHLSQSGVPCTIERSLPGWTRKGWYSVVSVKGFESSKASACQKEMKTMQSKQLEPHAYKWRAVQS